MTREFEDTDVRIGGRVTVQQGDDILVDHAENHIVNLGLNNLMIFLAGSRWTNALVSNTFYSNRYYATMNCGSDTTHGTTYATTDLTNKISTAPSIMSSTAVNAQTTTRWVIQYIAMWNPGLITSQVGEIALYNGNFTGPPLRWDYVNTSYSATLFSRVSVADGDFVAFTPNAAQSLTITWEIGVNQ